MSYILDALRKSEQARGIRKTLGLIEPPHSLPPLKSIALWPYVIVFVLLLNAGFFAFWLHPWHRGGNADLKRGGISAGQSEETSRQAELVGPPAPLVLTGAKPEISETRPEEKEEPGVNSARAVPTATEAKKEDGQSQAEAGPTAGEAGPSGPIPGGCRSGSRPG